MGGSLGTAEKAVWIYLLYSERAEGARGLGEG
jgi:hypothetical protein